MGIFINNEQKKSDMLRIAELHRDLNAIMADPNVVPEIKETLKAELANLSTNISQQNLRKGVARQYTLDYLENLKARTPFGTNKYRVEYSQPTTPTTTVKIFNPVVEDAPRYEIVGLEPNIQERIQEFQNFLTTVLREAQTTATTDSTNYVGWNTSNTDKIDEWLSNLNLTGSESEQELLKKISYIGNNIIAKIGNENLSAYFENTFAPWLPGSAQAQAKAAAEAKAAQEAAYTEMTSPSELNAYSDLTNKGYVFQKNNDGSYTVLTSNGTPVSNEGRLYEDFTSNLYKKGWVIGPDGKLYLIDNYDDAQTNAHLLNMEGYINAIKAAKDRLSKKYPSIFSYKNGLLDSSFLQADNTVIPHNDNTFVDLSYYFPGTGYVLGVQKDSDKDNAFGYNWNETDRQFYVSKDGQYWQVVTGIDNVKTALEQTSGFNYAGADRNSDPSKDEMSQFDATTANLPKPEDWDNITIYPWLDDQIVSGEDNNTILKQMIELFAPGKFNEVSNTLGIDRVDLLKAKRNYMIKKSSYKSFYKTLILKALEFKYPADILHRLMSKYYLDDSQIPVDITEDNYQTIKAQAEQKSQQYAEGGVLKLDTGGQPWYVTAAKNQQVLPSSDTEEDMSSLSRRADANGITMEGQKKAETEMTFKEVLQDPSMKLRLGALSADILALLSSLVPAYGTATSAVLGTTSAGLDFLADKQDSSVSATEMGLNLAANIGFGLIGLIPGGKAWGITKKIIKYAPALLSIGLPTQLIDKLKNGESWTYDDWRTAHQILSTVVGGLSNKAHEVKLRNLKQDISSSGIGKHRVKGKDYTFTTNELEEIDFAGRKSGQKEAIATAKRILMQKYPDDENVKELNLGISYGKSRQDKEKFNAWQRLKNRTRGIRSIYDATEEIQSSSRSPIVDYYKNNPYRKGTPKNPSNKSGWFATDYAIANVGGFGPLTRLSRFLGAKMKNISFGFPVKEGFDVEYARVKKGNTTEDVIVKRGNTAAAVQNGDAWETIELKPGKEGEWVNVNNDSDIYVKRNGEFVKKTSEHNTTSPQSTESTPKPVNNTTPDTAPEQMSEVTITKLRKIKGQTGYDQSLRAHQKNGTVKKILSIQEVQQHLQSQGQNSNVQTGGFITKDGTLIYRHQGGKLNRLFNYMNNRYE